MSYVANEPETMTGANDLGTKGGEPAMRDDPGLAIADVVERVMHQLHVTHATLVSLFEALQSAFEEIKPLHIAGYGGLPGGVRVLEIGGVQRAGQPVTGEHRV